MHHSRNPLKRKICLTVPTWPSPPSCFPHFQSGPLTTLVPTPSITLTGAVRPIARAPLAPAGAAAPFNVVLDPPLGTGVVGPFCIMGDGPNAAPAGMDRRLGMRRALKTYSRHHIGRDIRQYLINIHNPNLARRRRRATLPAQQRQLPLVAYPRELQQEHRQSGRETLTDSRKCISSLIHPNSDLIVFFHQFILKSDKIALEEDHSELFRSCTVDEINREKSLI